MSITSVVNDNIGDSSFINAQKPIPPTITNYVVSGTDDAALLPAGGQTVLINGTGFQRGATVSLSGTAIGVVTWVSANQLSFTSPASAAGTYTLFVINADGGTAIFVPGLVYSNNPTWVTSAGTLGSYYETQAISNNVVATDDTGSAMTYSLASGSLPSGATLYANGLISGTAPVDSGSTTYSFTIDATDTTLQSTTRAFSLTINTDVVTWVNPSNGATISIDGTAYSNVLVATDAAGYNIASYTANALPAGLALVGNTISGTPTTSGSTTTLLTATAATTNRSATNTITWVVSLNDAFFDYVTTLISANTPITSVFVDDASTNNFPVTIVGDTRPNNFSPYTPGYYSNFFDGTGDYLSVPSNAAFAFGTGDFTIEFWAYPTVNARQDWIDFDNGGGYRLLIYYNGTNIIYYSNAARITGSAMTLNTWQHIAVVRSSGSTKLYINGSQSGSTYSDSINFLAQPLTIAKDSAGSTYVTGYMSNIRVVKGTAVYTANFTPPTQPLTAIPNTVLLTCQSNRFIDNSANNFALTVTGNTAVNGFTPFLPNTSYSTYGSTYFDGTGDYLTVPSNAAFNITSGSTDSFSCEFWVNFATVGANRAIIDNGGLDTVSFPNWNIYLNASSQITMAWGVSGAPGTPNIGILASSTVPVVGQWYHIALVKTNADWALFINGTRATSFNGGNTAGKTSATALYIGFGISGAGFAGYISNVRIYNGATASAPYAATSTTITVPTEPLTAITNTSLLTCQTNQPVNNNVFIDNSTNNFLITRNGNTSQGTFSPYGENWSNYFDGTGDYLTVASSSAFNISGNFTIEGWYSFTALPGAGTNDNLWTFSGATTYNPYLYLWGDGTVILRTAQTSGTVFAITHNFTLNTWYHIAVVKSGTTFTLYINGTSAGTGTSSAIVSENKSLEIGGPTTFGLTGYLSNFRVVTGTALYTANFTPSTTPLLPIAGTSLLTCKDPNIVDDSANRFTITRTGDVSVQKFGPFASTALPTPYYSGYFDGTGDYLTLPPSTLISASQSTFTIEGWLYMTANPVAINGNVPAMFGDMQATGATNYFCMGPVGTGPYYFGFYWYDSAAKAVRGDTTLSLNTWYHLAVSVSSNTIRLFVNGTLQTLTGTTTLTNRTGTGTYTIGSYNNNSSTITGYISNLRVVTGTAVYTSTFTPPTAPLTAISGTSLLTCQNNTFIDNSTNNVALTAGGNTVPTTFAPFDVTYSTGQGYTSAVFGGSVYFDGTGDYLSLAASSRFDITSGDFTVQCWVYNTGAGAERYLFSQRGSGSGWGWRINATNLMQFYFTSGSTLISTGTIPANAWTHLAVTRSGNTLRMFINGIQDSSTTFSNGNTAASIALYVGWVTTGGGLFLGYMSDASLVKGTAVYTSSFVPQNSPVTAVRNTTLLVNGTSAGVYDSSMMNNYETVGDAKIDTTVVKFTGTESMKFDGTGDYLLTPAVQQFNMWQGDSTVECWVYFNSVSSSPHIINIGESASYRVVLFVNASTLRFFTQVAGNAADRIVSGTTLVTGQWYHIALTKQSTTWTLWLNGTSQGTSTTTVYPYGPAESLAVGFQNFAGGAGDYLNGYVSDLRITKGIARYTANFTVPAASFQDK